MIDLLSAGVLIIVGMCIPTLWRKVWLKLGFAKVYLYLSNGAKFSFVVKQASFERNIQHLNRFLELTGEDLKKIGGMK